MRPRFLKNKYMQMKEKKCVYRAVAVLSVFAAVAAFCLARKKAIRQKSEKSGEDNSYGKAGYGERNIDRLKRDGGPRLIISEPAYFKNFKGYFVRPENPPSGGGYPGVIMIHEYWGLNQYIKSMAEELAKEGYAVLAVDLFGQTAADPERAREMVSGVDRNQSLENLKAAVGYLREKEKVSRIASIGWCFGGGQSLRLALSGIPLDATVIYYGNLTSDRGELAKIKWPVLGIFGDKDQVVSPQSVKDFEAALNELGTRNEIHVYPGLGHAFANPSGPNHSPAETRDAWDKTLAFLDRNLKQPEQPGGKN